MPAMPMAPRPMCARTKFNFCILESCLGRAGCSSEECCPDPGVRAVRVGLRDRRGRCTTSSRTTGPSWDKVMYSSKHERMFARRTAEARTARGLALHGPGRSSLARAPAFLPPDLVPGSTRGTGSGGGVEAGHPRPAHRGDRTRFSDVSRPGSTSLARPRNIAIAHYS